MHRLIELEPPHGMALLGIHPERPGVVGERQEPDVQVQVRRLGAPARDGMDVDVEGPGRVGCGTTAQPVSSLASRSAVARRSSPSGSSTCPPGCSHLPSFRCRTSATRVPSLTTALPVKCAAGWLRESGSGSSIRWARISAKSARSLSSAGTTAASSASRCSMAGARCSHASHPRASHPEPASDRAAALPSTGTRPTSPRTRPLAPRRGCRSGPSGSGR